MLVMFHLVLGMAIPLDVLQSMECQQQMDRFKSTDVTGWVTIFFNPFPQTFYI